MRAHVVLVTAHNDPSRVNIAINQLGRAPSASHLCARAAPDMQLIGERWHSERGIHIVLMPVREGALCSWFSWRQIQESWQLTAHVTDSCHFILFTRQENAVERNDDKQCIVAPYPLNIVLPLCCMLTEV